MWRIVKKIFFWITGVILSVLFLTAVLIYVFEDDIKQYAIERLNEQLETRVDVEEIELSIWKRFPYASLTFKNVLIRDAFQYNKGIDTLFFAENIYFDFSLYDLWNEDYNVKKIEATNGVFNMKVNEKGEVNYNILKSKEDDSEGNFEFALEQVEINNFRYTLLNEQTGQDYNLRLNQAELQGDFLAESYKMHTKVDVDVNHIKSGPIPILFNQTFKGEVDVAINHLDTSYTINASDVFLSDIPLYFKGQFHAGDFDIQLKGKGLNLAEVTNKMQGQYNTDFTMYKGSGAVNFDLKVINNDSTHHETSISSDFSVQKGNLFDPATGLSLKNIQVDGYYHAQKSQKQQLKLENMHFETLKGNFDGSVGIDGFKLPVIEAKMKGSLDLATIHRFFKLQMFKQLDGTIAANVDCKIIFKNIKDRPDQFFMERANGAFELIQSEIQLANDSRVWKNIDGRFVLSGNHAAMQNVKLKLGSSDLQLNGALQDFVPFLQKAGALKITASLESERIKIEDFYNQYSRNVQAAVPKKLLPQNVLLDFTGNIKNLSFEHHPYQNVYGHAILKNEKLVLNKMRFQNAGGQYYGSVVINDQPKNVANISVHLNASKIDIKNLFEEWNNFDQQQLMAKNVSGKLSTDIEISVPIQRSGKVIYRYLKGNVDMKIDDGVLKDMPLMITTANYLGENKIIKLALGSSLSSVQEKLKDLKFQQLATTFQIKDQKIIMPETTIKSNLISLNLSAEHNFNNDIDYHFDFRFRELKIQNQQSEFGNIQDDGTGIQLFFRMYGNTRDPQFSFDKDKKKEARKEKFEQEKQTVKSILKEEFNLYKNDTSVKGMDTSPKEKQVDFQFSGEGFDEENEKEQKEGEDNKKKINKFFQKLKNEQKKENKEEETIEIGI